MGPDLAANILTASPLPSLAGKRILVVEDDYVLATDICRAIADLGATVLGPAPTPFYALGLLGRRGVDAAVLDIRLHGADVFDVADELMARRIPIVFATAMERDAIPLPYRGHPLLNKPVDFRQLHAALIHVLPNTNPVSPPPHAPSLESHDNRLMHAIVRAMRLSQT